ncbi:MAG: M14 family metallopeptidase, partial [Bacteroidota bacterium]|nr:M14 family metallopeptidase [Bacteroidota bacterium]
MKLLLALPLALVSILASGQEKLPTPSEFLGYEIGDRFTSHAKAVEYFQLVARMLPNAEIYNYGKTYEHRPLVYLVITSEDNFKSLEQIRTDNLRRTGLEPGTPLGKKIAIVWLSYNVHGNEASSTEASMQTLYELGNVSNRKTQEWLENTVVIIDPCINPDGRDRYTNFYDRYGNAPANASFDAFEHHEPWPGGRSNHYFFDLNRDWAWCSQIESQQRIKVYSEWMPHVHVDFHEQGFNSPYFFAPAAEPMHEVISPWQRQFQLLIGKNNARYFDEKGWLYFTKEVFDLYYPSYGDTYPTYNGAIGMTYEQGGGGAGGLSITTETGEPLTLRDRIQHHVTSGLSTVEISSLNAEEVTDEFQKYFRENNDNPAATYKTYVIKASNNPDKVRQLTDWMDRHSIRYGHPSSARNSRGFNYQTQSISSLNVATDDLLISVYQPKSRFITTIFEPKSHLSDSLTYDITAWNLMYSYNFDAYALTERINVGRPYVAGPQPQTRVEGQPYAYLFRYSSLRDVEFLSALMQHDIKVRRAAKSFAANGVAFAAGSLIVTRRNNEDSNAFDETIKALAEHFDRRIFTAESGFVEEGKDLGSGELNFLPSPEVAMLFGDQTSALSAGEVWHFFEQQIHYPITQIGTDYFSNAKLSRYDVLIVPEGSYKLFDEPTLERLSAWIRDGGCLILLGNALDSFVDRKGFGLKKYATDAERQAAEKSDTGRFNLEGVPRYEEIQRRQLSEKISGAIYKAHLDNSHPLAFGMKRYYYTLKT